MASILDLVKHYQHAIEKYPNDEQKILKCIDKLFNLGVTVQHLQETGVGRTVNALRKEPGDVGPAARALVYKWKLMVAAEESDHDDEQTQSATACNGYRNGKTPEDSDCESKNNSTQYDKYNKTDREHERYSNSQHINGGYSGGKRKYHSSEEEESQVKKSRQATQNEIQKQVSDFQVKREQSETEHDSHSTSSPSEDSDSEDSEQSEEVKTSKTISQKEHTDKHHTSSTKHSSHSTHEKDKKSLSSSGKSHEHPDKHHKHSHSENKHKSDKSSREKSSSSDKYKKEKEKESGSHKKEKLEHKSSDKDKKKVESKDHSSSKHKSSSEKHKSSSSSEKSKSQSEKSSSKSEQQSSHKQKSEKDKHKHSPEKSNEKNKSKEHSSKDRHSSSSKEKTKEKNSSSKDKENSHKSDKKHSSSSDTKENISRSKSEKDNHKSSSSKEKKSHSSSSHSSKSSKSSSSKSKDTPKKKVYKDENEDSEDGIDCGSGASFAEALGMISPSKPKKKFSLAKDTSHSPNNSGSNDDLSPAALLAPTAKLAPLPALEISALPEISPHYKPRPPPRFLPHFTDEEALSAGISSKNQRTKVYSGNKVIGKIPTLYEMCVQILQEHIDALEYTGGVPYEILKPVVDKATPQQLYMLEHFNPYLMEDTDHLWQKFCEKNFRTKKREELESWREMYMRCQEEQENKLKSLTANIRIAQEAKKAPVKQTKMAYVDSIVKPPRSVARKQAQHGTAFAASASPAARVAALAAAPGVLKPGARAAPLATPTGSSTFQKPKKAPLMQKALQFMRGRKR